ncbi:ATP-dependent Clp protease ATP-binding subunit ClpX [Croceicoccus gelatinilyticus]|uniref:ATP-dependent Clp protease ATP-binding subunit ClpX n=1 Tax=Croceicoccus gelatinilyticus TaxID=2835536 RepID=UPI001BD0544D|nr:ATP-dependent Clp protease ATP-binding subunit ClpX [Croceicoccus gelatinilyticus]MBS7671398.1 ATP-dependent Clp protease ATP-binding subunit ClpX [Croceicoccus gelatinilyticus]
MLETMKECSFCRNPQNKVNVLVAGPPGIAICDSCTETAAGAVAEQTGKTIKVTRANALKDTLGDIPNPRAIGKLLDDYVIGQQEAKQALSVAVYNHYKRLLDVDGDVEVQKSNVLLLGPTGTGKTLLAQTIAKHIGVPFAIADATSLTQAGYVGDDIESIIAKLLVAADGDVEKAERGIIYIDEIDKIAAKGDGPSVTRDVSGEGVQQGLLKIIEGTVANVPGHGGRKNPHETMNRVDTKNILFICAGAFPGLEKIVQARKTPKGIGFGATMASNDPDERPLEKLETSDLARYGMIQEFIGRLPVITHLNALTREDLVKILTEPKNALVSQYSRIFEREGVTLSFEDGAIEAIADAAIAKKTGARGLRSIMEKLLQASMYEVLGDETVERVIVTKASVEGAEKVAHEKKRKAA